VPIQPITVPDRALYSSLMAMTRPSSRAASASMPPLAGWRPISAGPSTGVGVAVSVR
jgi:hypothetical protein